MAEVKVPLKHGLKIGETVFKEAVLREATAGDFLQAQEDSEKLVMVPNEEGKIEPQFIPSPSLMTGHQLRRQLKFIGDVSGPFELDDIHRLHPDDLSLLLAEQDALLAASINTLQAVAQSGRPGSDSENG
ncbi:phage tail assembly protein [Methylophaga nitratireducenticrescens]|uniref:phage tail assembly protein n=1 Tax=Methylophaga nitratireducenticrescens TaxID=754476 RepID=UPI000CDBFC58|nr:phage tail assembly protein [Methylophaga nitratireducenticrescens]AUZ85788.1 hypothetical protein CDW43_14990 [Methylophaga nitratireducenticrescens]AUZ85845.1 hypothetical protein CDW43_15290 [Methylophaga nitratireducenticrescens]